MKLLIRTSLALLFTTSLAMASISYGPTSLSTSKTVSSTSFIDLVSQGFSVTNSVRSCYTDPTFGLELCSYSNSVSVVARTKFARQAALKYRLTLTGLPAQTPSVTDNGDGTLTLSTTFINVTNGTKTLKLQAAKKASGDPSTTINPAAGDVVSLGATVALP